MKKEGVTKEDAYSFFTNLRNKMTEEKNDNKYSGCDKRIG